MSNNTSTSESKVFNGVVSEYEVDSSWKSNLNQDYWAYREKFENLLREKPIDPGPFPLCLEIEATYHCNLECPFCARSTSEGYRKINHMPKETWSRIVDEIRSNYLPSIMMDHEGESLLNPELCNMIADVRDAHVIDVFLHTNGQALTPSRSRDLIEAGLTKLNVSIDAVSEETYSIVRPGGLGLAKVKDNVESFLALRKSMGREDIRLRVSFVVTPDNAHEMKAFFDQWKDKVNLIAFQNMIEMTPFASSMARDSYIQECVSAGIDINGFRCDHLWGIPVIDSEGNFLPCGMPVREHTDDFIIGNINEGDTISGCWSGKKLSDLRRAHLKSNFSGCSMCEGCAYAQQKTNTRTN